MVVWPIVPPRIGERIQDEFECKSGLLSRHATAAKLNSEADARARVFKSAKQIADHIMSEKPGWGPWPEDLNECASIGLVLGAWLVNSLQEVVTERKVE